MNKIYVYDKNYVLKGKFERRQYANSFVDNQPLETNAHNEWLIDEIHIVDGKEYQVCYHVTTKSNWELIQKEGLKVMLGERAKECNETTPFLFSLLKKP